MPKKIKFFSFVDLSGKSAITRDDISHLNGRLNMSLERAIQLLNDNEMTVTQKSSNRFEVDRIGRCTRDQVIDSAIMLEQSFN